MGVQERFLVLLDQEFFMQAVEVAVETHQQKL
jgi:hypothetical protein